MSTELLDLPVELIEEIYSILDSKTLRSVRLVSRGCAQIRVREFADMHFEQLNIVFSCKESLERGLAILQHPSFGTRVRKTAVYLDEYIKTIDGYQDIGGSEAYRAYDICRQKLRQRGLDRKLLQQIFQEAHTLNKLNDVKIETAYDKIWWPGMERECPRFAGHVSPDLETCHRFMQVLEILSENNLSSKFAGMTISKDTFWSLPIHEAMKYEAFREDFEAALDYTTSLSMDIWIRKNAYPHYCRDFFGLVAAAPKLRHLGIKSRNEADGTALYLRELSDVDMEVTGKELLAQTFPMLQSLELRYLNFRLAELVGFLTRHPKVSKLKFVGVEIDGQGHGEDMDGSHCERLANDLARITERQNIEVDSSSQMFTL